MSGNDKIKFFSIFIFLFLSLIPFLKILIFKNYSHFFVYDEISFESVVFYLTKSYSLINNKSLSYVENIDSNLIFLSNDFIPNIINSIFVLIFKEYSNLFLNLFTSFISLSLIFFFLIKVFKFEYSESLLLTVILFIFLGIGPDSIITIYDYFFFNELRETLFLRYFSPSLTIFMFLTYLFFLNNINKKKNFKWLSLFSILNIFTYFYSSLIIFALNSLLSFKYLKLKNYKSFIIINSITLIGCFFYLYLFFIYQEFLQAAEVAVPNFKIDLEFILSNYRNNLVSLILLILVLIFKSKLDNEIIRKLLLMHFVFQCLTIFDLFLNIQINLHLSMYFFRPLNWISLFYLIYKLFLFKQRNFFLVIFVIYVSFSYFLQNYKYYSNINLENQKNLKEQIKIVNNLKNIEIFLQKENINKKEIFINDSYTNMIFSSIISPTKNNLFIKNSGLFRSNKNTIEDRVKIFTDYCTFFDIKKDNCYYEFLANHNNKYFNNSFIFTGNRKFNRERFDDFYKKSEYNKSFLIKKSSFLIQILSYKYHNLDSKLIEEGFNKQVFDNLILYY